MQPTTATQSTMNKTHTNATLPKSYYTHSGMPKSWREHIWKSISYKKIHHLHHFNTPHTLHDSPVVFWKLKGERPSGGNVCASRFVILYVSFSLCEQFCNQVSQLQKWWMHMDTLQFSTAVCFSPVILSSESLAEQLEDISPISCELFIGVSRAGLSPVAILNIFHNSLRYAGASREQT